MTHFHRLYCELIEAMGVEGLSIPTTAVRFFTKEQGIPEEIAAYAPGALTLTSCQAAKQAALDDPVLLTVENIGCVAAAISLGLVDQHQREPLSGSRVYTEIMREQRAEPDQAFRPPAPHDFTEGLVYACRDAERPEFCLFGDEDVGRYQDVATARRAVSEMMAIQPAIMRGVLFHPPTFPLDIAPDVVVLSVRPVELTRLVQAYQFNTGKRLQASMGGVRVVNSDLIVRPYLTGEPNVSTYCLGARLLARYGPDRLGIGMPFSVFCQLVEGMSASRTGFPFHLYPGADGW